MAADADDARAVRDERQRGGGENEPAAPSGAPQGGATDGGEVAAFEAAYEGPIPEDVELAAGAIPSDLFEASEAPRVPPAARTVTPGGAPVAGRQRRSADLTGALLGSGASAQEAPDALRDTVAAIEELFPGTLVASLPREDTDTDVDSEVDAGSGEATDATSGDERPPGVEPPDEDADVRGGPGAAGLFDVDDGAQATRGDAAPGGRRTTPDRSEAG